MPICGELVQSAIDGGCRGERENGETSAKNRIGSGTRENESRTSRF